MAYNGFLFGVTLVVGLAGAPIALITPGGQAIGVAVLSTLGTTCTVYGASAVKSGAYSSNLYETYNVNRGAFMKLYSLIALCFGTKDNYYDTRISKVHSFGPNNIDLAKFYMDNVSSSVLKTVNISEFKNTQMVPAPD
ncbi:hypothetical protein [Burkholderia pyrrocinia]|uniref:hypothetical protein n=1 Tax=Burkholderia pyrrocinia TaxID=60550 RepID=UPI00158D69D4|nr:hypothetical protein [Burkholderia pyrrocinia]